MKAALLTSTSSPLEIVDDVEHVAPQDGEIVVRLLATGVCHSDLSAAQGTLFTPLPIVLGHEACGVVEQLGDSVNGFDVGDKVVLSWIPQCGACFYCTRGEPHLCTKADTTITSGGLLDGTPRLRRAGADVYQFICAGAFAERAVVPAISAVKVPSSLPADVAALLGCAVLTGTGAAMRTTPVQPEDFVVVMGCGGVGLNIIQGALLRNAETIVACDLDDEKLALASKLGATDIINAGVTGLTNTIMDMTSERGADLVFEAVGSQATIDEAIAVTRRGGTTTLVGVPSFGTVLEIPAMLGLVMADKTIRGCWYGSSNIRRDIPELISLYESGRLFLDELITARYPLEGVNTALDAMRSNSGARSVIEF